MPRPVVLPRLGQPKPVPVKLSSDLALELQAFCEAHFKAQQAEVICRAVERFIQQEIASSDTKTKERFTEARGRLIEERRKAAADGLRLVVPRPDEVD
jgi:hypothetical protein